MASNFIDRIQIGNDQIAIGSSAYAICNTQGNLAAKTATIPGFYLNEGTTIYIKFTSANTASNPTLNISNTGAIPIVQYSTTVAGTANETTGWENGAVLSFTLTKENNNWYWSKVSGYSVDTHYTASLISGTSSSITNTSVSSGNNIYLRLFDGGTNQSNLQLEEGNNMIISSDANGIITFSATDTTYSTFVQSGPSAAEGLVPAPSFTEGSDLFLCEDGTWATPNYTTSLPLSAITNTTNLQIIEGLTGTGLLEKTNNGWELDTNTYLTSQNTAYIYATTENGTSNASNETNPYLTLIDGTTTSRVQLEGNGYTSIVADNGVITISTNITAVDLELSNAMHFIGIVASNSTYQPSDNTYPNPDDPDNPTSLTLEGNITYNSPNDGDVILDKDCIREYVWSGGENGSWKLLGFSASTDYTSVPGSNLNTEDIPQWIYQITQQTDGTVRAYYKTLGVIPVTHGGTGISVSPTQYGIIYGEKTNDSIPYYTSTSAGGDGKVLIGKGSSNAPEWYDGLLLTSSTTNNTTTYLATFSNNVSIGGTLDVIGAATLYNTLLVTGNTSIGASGTASTLTVWGATSLKSTLNVLNAVTFENTLEVTGASTLTGNVGIGADADNTFKLYVNGGSKFNGDIVPQTNQRYSLGEGTTPLRWSSIYVGSKNSYGDAYTPIYWNNGVPEEVQTIQQANFTITNSGANAGTATISTNTSANSMVVEIVVKEDSNSHISNLQSPVTWEVSNGTIVLTATVGGRIDGYVLYTK